MSSKGKINTEVNTDEVKSLSLFQQSWIQFKRNRMAVVGLIVIGILILISLGTIIIDIVTKNAIYDQYVVAQNLTQRLAKPSAEHIFGCDELGRDLFFRVLWGTRLSLFIGLAAIIIATVAGGILGLIAGYYGGVVDTAIMRVMDVLLAIPYMLLAMAIVSALGTSTRNLLIALSVPNIAKYARIARAAVLTEKDKEYVEAMRANGAGDLLILFKYILPNAFAPILVQVTLGIGDSILAVAGLSFLGIGVQPPSAEWGAILTTARTYMRDAMHVSVFPGAALIITVMVFNLFGDGLRDAMDPKLKR
ncbi:MAG: ABC transporter permease [Eubacteriales bacterium]|nr:ABC transporter permease [Eubacteriales bacterium]